MSVLTPEQKRVIEIIVRGKLVGKLPVSYEGFEHYHFCRYQRPVPHHAVKWVNDILWAYENGSGALVEAFRGATKSTIAGLVVCEYLFGKNPEKSGVILSATGPDADAIGKYVADAISISTGWKAAFPNIVPDPDRGWGAENGYFVKNTDVDYNTWVDMQMADHQRDPSFMASSVMSGTVGRHPTLYLFPDDIHTGKNTTSPQEMKQTKARFFSDAFPTLNNPKAKPILVSAYTPWDEEDTNSEIKRSNVYRHSHTPILKFDPEGNETWEGEKCFLTWPEAFPMEEIKKLRSVNTASEFARMYLCDLTRAKDKIFKYTTFPHEKIDPTWVRAGGVDYASFEKATRTHDARRSSFAYCLGTKTPYNTLVIADGFVGQITQYEGEQTVQRFQNMSVNFRVCMIENKGGGKEFLYMIARNPKMKVQEHGVTKSNKDNRIYEELSTLLEQGVLQISDEDKPFLNCARRYFDRFPNIGEHEPEKDVADSIYHMVAAFPEIHKMPSAPKEGLRQFEKPKINLNPWAHI